MSFAPIHHFTDHKIRIHLFTCVLALSVAHLMRREAERAGLHLSVPVQGPGKIALSCDPLRRVAAPSCRPDALQSRPHTPALSRPASLDSR